MVLVNIIVANLKEVGRVVRSLLGKKLFFDAFLLATHLYAQTDEMPTEEKNVVVLARTKALLFHRINEALAKLKTDKPPLLFATPIVYMNPDQSKQLRSETLEV